MTNTTTTATAAVMSPEAIIAWAERIVRDELELRWVVRVDPKLRTTWGVTYSVGRSIELNPLIPSVTDIERTILHEVAHAQRFETILLDRHYRPQSDRVRRQKAGHHDAAWKAAYAALLAKYGYAPEPVTRFL